MPLKKCTLCSIEKDLTEFAYRSKAQNRRLARCSTCMAEIALTRAYSNYSKNQKDNREKRVDRGGCRFCNAKAIADKKYCERHYVAKVADDRLGTAKIAIADLLLNRFHQNPYCPYTGELLVLGVNAHLDHILSLKNRPDLKSDVNNVEWISETANLSKNGFNKEEFIDFCKLIAKRFS